MFSGSIPALITPFKNGAVDIVALESLVAWHIKEGSNGLVAVGTTGESPTLSHDEHKKVIEVVVKSSMGKVPVIAGAGSNNTSESVELIKFASKIGADGALVVTPYYNKPNQRGLYAHFATLNDSSDLPIIIYNIPGRSVIDMTVETMSQLSKLKNIVGVKDATGNLERVNQQLDKMGKEFIQLTGNDDNAFEFNQRGGVGTISVTANIAPKLCSEFQKFSILNDEKSVSDAERLNQKQDAPKVLKEFLTYKGPAFLEVIIDPEAGVYPMVPPGMSYQAMLTGDFIPNRYDGTIKEEPNASELF